MKILEFKKLDDIPVLLRTLANDIEQGNDGLNGVDAVVCVVAHLDGIATFGFGKADAGMTVLLLESAKVQFVKQVLDGS